VPPGWRGRLRRPARCSLRVAQALADIVAAAGGVTTGQGDPRFQAWLKGGNPWARGPLLAKSKYMAQSHEESCKARERAGYPQGGRHELLSVRLLESVPNALPNDEALRDLLLHLIEVTRPLPAVRASGGGLRPVQVSVDFAGKTYTPPAPPAWNASTPARPSATGASHAAMAGGDWLGWKPCCVADHRRSEWKNAKGRRKTNE